MTCREIELTKGFRAIVDASDYDRISKHKWCYSHGYAVRRRPGGGRLYMHQQIMGEQKGLQIDHKDGNRLNNSRYNLRHVTKAENIANRSRANKNKKSGLPVSIFKSQERFEVKIMRSGKKIYIGRFASVAEAQKALDGFK